MRVSLPVTIHPRCPGSWRLACHDRWSAVWSGVIVFVLTCVSAAGLPAGDLAVAQVPEVGNDVLAALEHTGEFIADGQWSDAVETLARIMENQGDALIQTPVAPRWQARGFAAYIPLRQFCQMEMASWHTRAPAALETYRQRVDGLAARWYEEALAARSEVQLQRIVDELLLSSSGDQALLRLGELALERGNYTLARRSWESLSPQLRVPPAVAHLLDVPPGCSWWSALRGRSLDHIWQPVLQALQQPVRDANWLAYPDTEIPLAAVRARLTLVSLLEGSRERAELELELLRRLDPAAEGALAGRQGTYVALMEELSRDAAGWPTPMIPPGWTTLAGCPTRNRVAEAGVDMARRPIWRTALPQLDDDQDRLSLQRRRVGERADGLLSYAVAAVDGVAYVLQPGMIRAIEVETGKPAWPLTPSSRMHEDISYGAFYQWSRGLDAVTPRRSAHAGVPRYAPSVDRCRLFARMGHAWTGGSGDELIRADQRSFIVGFDLRTQKLLFDRILPGEAGWEFESAPLADKSHLFVSLRRRDPASAQVRVASYSIETGQLVWQRDIVRGEAISDVLFEISNSALALRDDMLFYNTNLGAVAALRASDGRLCWICRYRRAGLRDAGSDEDDRHVFRDQTPCLVDRDLVIAAPADCDQILAIDAAFGQVVWATAAGVAADAVHLLGVGQEHLLASGDHLYWINLASGKLDFQFPAPRSPLRGYAAATPRGYGRGILAGDQVYWPTLDHVYVFEQRSNRQVRQPIALHMMGITGGNLVIHNGTLLIATADQLVALNQSGQVARTRLEVAPPGQ